MYNIVQRNEIVENFLNYIGSSPQCPCCVLENNGYSTSSNHFQVIIGDESINLGSIIDVEVPDEEGYIDIIRKWKPTLRVNERCFEDFLSCSSR